MFLDNNLPLKNNIYQIVDILLKQNINTLLTYKKLATIIIISTKIAVPKKFSQSGNAGRRFGGSWSQRGISHDSSTYFTP